MLLQNLINVVLYNLGPGRQLPGLFVLHRTKSFVKSFLGIIIQRRFVKPILCLHLPEWYYFLGELINSAKTNI